MAETTSTGSGKLRLVVVTHDRKVLDEPCDEVQVPGQFGAIGLLPGHAPLVAALKLGEVIYRQGRQERSLVASAGLVQVMDDVVTVLADRADLPAEIDLSAAQKLAKVAEDELMSATDPTWRQAMARLEEANVRIQVAKKPS